MMFRLKYCKVISLLRKNNLDAALKLLVELTKKYPQEHKIYLSIAKIYFRKNQIKECKQYLNKIISLSGWYKKEIVKEILEITNWKMLVSNQYLCKEPSFSPDGEKIVFTCATEDTDGDGKITFSDCPGVYIISREGGDMECVVSNKYYNSSPSYSPDGRYIVYLSARRDTNNDNLINNRDTPGLYLLDLSTGGEKLLVEDRYGPKHPSFSPDGKKIIFSCWRTPTSCSGIYEVDIHTLKTTPLVSERYENAFPSYSLNGTKIVFSSFRGQNEESEGIAVSHSGIYVKDLITSEEIVVDDKYINSFPVFSRDGGKVAFLSKRRDTNNDGKIDSLDNDGIYIFDFKSKKVKLVHTDKFYNKFINFTPDNRRILFLSTWHRKYKDIAEKKDYREFKGIYICDLNGRHLRQIVSDKYYGCSCPVVSPVRNEVVYTSFRKDTLRGLYLAYIDEYPSPEEIVEIIHKNL